MYYSSNAVCRYYVHGLYPGFSVRLVFKAFDLEDSQGCQNDNFTIYEEQIAKTTIAGISCGQVTGDFFSKSRNLILIFRSNSVISGKGFSIKMDCKYFCINRIFWDPQRFIIYMFYVRNESRICRFTVTSAICTLTKGMMQPEGL